MMYDLRGSTVDSPWPGAEFGRSQLSVVANRVVQARTEYFCCVGCGSTADRKAREVLERHTGT